MTGGLHWPDPDPRKDVINTTRPARSARSPAKSWLSRIRDNRATLHHQLNQHPNTSMVRFAEARPSPEFRRK